MGVTVSTYTDEHIKVTRVINSYLIMHLNQPAPGGNSTQFQETTLKKGDQKNPQKLNTTHKNNQLLKHFIGAQRILILSLNATTPYNHHTTIITTQTTQHCCCYCGLPILAGSLMSDGGSANGFNSSSS